MLNKILPAAVMLLLSAGGTGTASGIPLRMDLPPGIPPNNELARDGLLDVTLYGADPEGKRDSTRAVQQAIDDAYQYQMVCFFPTGVYKVSDTLRCMEKANITARGRYYPSRTLNKAHALVGSTKGPRPVLRLIDHAPGFDDPAHPKPVVMFWHQKTKVKYGTGPAGSTDPAHNQADISFNQVFKGIDIEIGPTGNRGAIGISHGAAQGSSIEDVRIVARNAFAGVGDLCGFGGINVNIEVVGGRYGVYARRLNPVLVGVSLIDQVDSAICWTGWNPLTVVGFRIVKKKEPAIRLAPGAFDPVAHLNLLDGVIELTGEAGVAIDNTAGRNLAMRNVYIRNAAVTVKTRTAPPLENGPGWTLVREYAYCMPPFLSPRTKRRTRSYNWIDGRMTIEPYAAVIRNSAPPPPNLVTRHLYPTPFPSFEDPDAVNVHDLGAKGDGRTDDTTALQRAFDRPGKVFLPKGVYRTTRTLVPGPHTHLFGVAKHLSRIRPDFGEWKPTRETPVIATVDDPRADTSLSFLAIDMAVKDLKHAYWNALTWRVGRRSVVRDIALRNVDWVNPRTAEGTDRRLYVIRGNGGGRWYNALVDSPYNRTRHPGYRNILIQGTREPLYFYGFDSQRSNTYPHTEIVDARNVFIFGYFTEWLNSCRIQNCRNILVAGSGGGANNQFTLIDSEDVLLMNICRTVVQKHDGFMVREVRGDRVRRVSAFDLVTMYKRGQCAMPP